jgi:hypothetical protein
MDNVQKHNNCIKFHRHKLLEFIYTVYTLLELKIQRRQSYVTQQISNLVLG